MSFLVLYTHDTLGLLTSLKIGKLFRDFKTYVGGCCLKNLFQNIEIKTMVCSALVCPQIEYASAVWSPYTKEYIYINQIEKVNRLAAR